MAQQLTAADYNATMRPPAMPALDAPVALARNPQADLESIARLLRAGDVDTARKLADRWVK